MARARRLSSDSAMEPVAARPDPLEVGPRSADAGRKAAIDRIPGDGTSEEPFDRCVGLPHTHRAISLRQGLDDGPLDHAVAGTTGLWNVRPGSALATLIRKTPRKSIENARKRWGMV